MAAINPTNNPTPVPDGRGGVQYVDPLTYAQNGNAPPITDPAQVARQQPYAQSGGYNGSPAPQDTPAPGVRGAWGAPAKAEKPPARQNTPPPRNATTTAGGGTGGQCPSP